MTGLADLQFNVDPVKLNVHNIKDIQKKGFVYPTEEFIMGISDELKAFPLEITELSQDDLLNKMATFTSLYASVSVEEALATTEVAGYERDLEFTKAKVLQLSSLSKITDKRIEASANEEIVHIQEKLQVAEARQKLLSALRTSYDKMIFLFSRTLAVQTAEKSLQ